MRVIHVITRLIVGGAQENTIASLLGLRHVPGLEVELISGLSTGPEGTLEAMVQGSRALTVIPELVRPVSPWNDLVTLGKLTKIFRDRKPDIVHTHSGKAGLLGRAAAYRAGVPVIIHTIHGPSFGSFLNPIGNCLFRTAERWAGRRTSHFVVVANAMKEQYLAAGIGKPEQYTRIFSGFSLEPFLSSTNDISLRRKMEIGPEDLVIGKIARLFKLKGHDDLFEIAPRLAAEIPNIKFLLVGDGAWRQRFERRARDMRLEERFLFTGLVPPADVPGYLGICDMVVHLSRREGLARALPQAMAAGRPVIAYDCDGAGEVCIDGQTGFLVKPGDREALAERILTLARNAELRQQMGARGREWVAELFPVEKMVADLHELYEKLTRAAQVKPGQHSSRK